MTQDPSAPKPDPTTGDYRIVVEGIVNKLSVENYKMVTENGFFVFNERRLQPHDVLPSLYAIVGIEEKEIIRRHPYTVLTSAHPNKSELENMDKDG